MRGNNLGIQGFLIVLLGRIKRKDQRVRTNGHKLALDQNRNSSNEKR